MLVSRCLPSLGALVSPSLAFQCVVGLLGESEAESGRKWEGGWLRENRSKKHAVI